MKIDWLLHKLGYRIILNAALAVSGCMPPSLFYMDMDMDKNKGTPTPSVVERLFYVSQDVKSMELDFIINVNGGSGILQITDCNTDESIWQINVTKDAIFTQTIGPLQKDRKYMTRFTGVVDDPIRITVSSCDGRIQELTRPFETNERPAKAV